MGSKSGVSPTASASEKMRDEKMSCFATAFTRNMTRHKVTMIHVKNTLKLLMPRSNSLGRSFAVSRLAMSANFVARPVATTSMVPVPLTTPLPIYTTVLICFSTGSDSPVSADSFT